MTFQTLEISTDEGRPIFLYEFALGTTVWRYSAGPIEVLFAGQVYQPTAISDDGIKQSTDPNSDSLAITLPSRIGAAQVFIGSPPSSRVLVRVRHMHAGSTEAPLVYVGEILQVDWPEPGTVRLVAHTLSATLSREGLRLPWQRACPYALYDLNTCKVAKASHGTPAILLSASAGIITADAFAALPTGSLAGGFIEWQHPVRGTERRGIETHSGNEVGLLGLSDGLYYGLPVIAYRGCDRTLQVCNDVFDNALNYGGVPSMPGRSPFDGNPVF